MPVKIDSREYRGINAKTLELQSTGEGEKRDMTVEGYATTFNQPYELYRNKDGVLLEQVAPEAFDETDMNDVIMQYDHEGRVFARASNGTLELKPDEHGLRIWANLGGTEIGRQLYEEIVGGYTDKMSFGFTVEGEKREERRTPEGVEVLRTITKIGKLYDVSAVSLPANDATEISARTISDGLIAEAKKELQAREERAEKLRELRKLLKGVETDGN